MKKFIPCFLMLAGLLSVLSGCGGYDYSAHISDERSDLFRAETEDFTLTVACVEREHPFLTDGVAAERSRMLEAVLAAPAGSEYEIYFLEDAPKGGDMSFRSVSSDYYYSRSVEQFPSGSLSLRIVKDGVAEDLLATSVKTEHTLSPQQALDKALSAEKAKIDGMMSGGKFHGEFHVRLLKRDKTYYYVGIVDEKGILSLLLDSETGEVLARRQTET